MSVDLVFLHVLMIWCHKLVWNQWEVSWNKHECYLWWDSMHHNEWDIDADHVEDTAEEGNSSLPMERFPAKAVLWCAIPRVIHSLTHPQLLCQIQIVLPALLFCSSRGPQQKKKAGCELTCSNWHGCHNMLVTLRVFCLGFLLCQ